MKPVILLTGQPGVGKTLAIKSIISLLGNKVGGFYTQEVRAQGRRTGFEIVTLDGRTAWLAGKSSAVTFKEEIPFGNYRINLRAIDSTAVPALRRAAKMNRIIIIDEIGPMEIVSELFCKTVSEILKSQAIVVGTIVQRSYAFADKVRVHPRVHIKTVTSENRDKIPLEVVAELSQ